MRPINPAQPPRPKRPVLRVRFPEGGPSGWRVEISAFTKLSLSQIIVLDPEELNKINQMTKKKLSASSPPVEVLAEQSRSSALSAMAARGDSKPGMGITSLEPPTAAPMVEADPALPVERVIADQGEPSVTEAHRGIVIRRRKTAGKSASTKKPPDNPARRKRSLRKGPSDDDAPPTPVSGPTT